MLCPGLELGGSVAVDQPLGSSIEAKLTSQYWFVARVAGSHRCSPLASSQRYYSCCSLMGSPDDLKHLINELHKATSRF